MGGGILSESSVSSKQTHATRRQITCCSGKYATPDPTIVRQPDAAHIERRGLFRKRQFHFETLDRR
jgi:hypothetical protein